LKSPYRKIELWLAFGGDEISGGEAYKNPPARRYCIAFSQHLINILFVVVCSLVAIESHPDYGWLFRLADCSFPGVTRVMM
jgi:hypothetical protein